MAIEKALKLARIVTDLQIPPSFRDFSSWQKPGETEVTAMAYAMKRYRPSTGLKLRLSSYFSFRQKIRFLFRLIHPRPDMIRISEDYHTGSSLLFGYLRRWKRLAGEIMRFIVTCTHLK